MQRTQYFCVIIAALILVIPVLLFSLVLGWLSPPTSLVAWIYWILGAFAAWITTIAALAQFFGYDVRTFCSSIGDKFHMNKSELDSSASPQKIFSFLNERLNYEELRTLCFNLGVAFDDLGGEGKSAKMRELIQLCERREMLPQLVASANQIFKADK